MYYLYKKTEKTEENKFGLIRLKNDENPFMDKPCLLFILAMPQSEKEINGSLKQGMEVLRLKTSENNNSGLSISEFDGNLLGLAYGDKIDLPNNINGKFTQIVPRTDLTLEFIEKYFYPLISRGNERIDLQQAMRNMRNVNIMSYCNGTKVLHEIEAQLISKMHELGYTETEINQILLQMCIFPFADGIVNGTEKSTCITFKDLRDFDCRPSISSPTIKQAIIEQAKEDDGNIGLYRINDNEYIYMVVGDGEHKLKRYTKGEDGLSVGMASVITKALDNSIRNFRNADNEFTSITAEILIEDIPNILSGIRAGKNNGELMEIVDSKIQYTTSKPLRTAIEATNGSRIGVIDMQEMQILTQENGRGGIQCL